MNVWLKSKCVWTSPVSGFSGFPVTSSGEMWRSKAAMGCFLGFLGEVSSCSCYVLWVLRLFISLGLIWSEKWRNMSELSVYREKWARFWVFRVRKEMRKSVRGFNFWVLYKTKTVCFGLMNGAGQARIRAPWFGSPDPFFYFSLHFVLFYVVFFSFKLHLFYYL